LRTSAGSFEIGWSVGKEGSHTSRLEGAVGIPRGALRALRAPHVSKIGTFREETAGWRRGAGALKRVVLAGILMLRGREMGTRGRKATKTASTCSMQKLGKRSSFPSRERVRSSSMRIRMTAKVPLGFGSRSDSI
jgi:hypothetical protein